MSEWQQLRRGLYRFQDSCVVYAIETSAGMLLFNAGTGAWLETLDELPARPHCLILTHFFRDHSSGAPMAAARGIPVWAPYWEKEQLADATSHFTRRETYIIYDNTWDLFAPVEDVPVSRWLRDWEVITIGDAELKIVPTPGATLGSISVQIHRESESGVVCGEVIHSPGKVPRVAPFQYNYNDFDGAANLVYSIDQIRKLNVDWIAGSMAPELILEPDPALDLLEKNLVAALTSRGGYEGLLKAARTDELEQITPHLFRSRSAVASTYFLVSSSGKVLAIDYGYRSIGEDFGSGIGLGGAYSFPRHRRPLLHGLEPLARIGVDRIDAVLVTHFHDDHINGIPMLQRIWGTRCFAGDTFAFILADPQAFAFPCTWPEPIQVTSVPTDEPFRWEEFEFGLHPISGHTRYATLVSFETDGEKIVATGDQFFFQDFDHPGTGPAAHNHVYRNGAVLASFSESAGILKRLEPTVILPGHGPAYRVPPEFFQWIDRYVDDYEQIHRDLMPLGADEVHFEVDSRAAWLEPYRTRLDTATPVAFTVHVRNPYPDLTTLSVRLVVPSGWDGTSTSLTLEPRSEGTAKLVATPPAGTVCRRCAVAVDVSGPDRLFGQVAEALITIGHPVF